MVAAAKPKHLPVELFDTQTTELEQWQKDIQRDGYVVIKGAVSRERTDAYVNEMYKWLEDL